MTRYHLSPGAVKGDPYPLTCKFGTCSTCGKSMRGEHGFYWPKMSKGKQVYCDDCGYADYQSFVSAALDEMQYGGY